MGLENRQNTRFKEIGRVTSQELCAIPGILDDISLTGCKVHFPCSVIVDLENEYELNIGISRTPNESPLKLMCQPQWTNEYSGNTDIGFKILYSPDASRLKEFINLLQNESNDDILSEIVM